MEPKLMRCVVRRCWIFFALDLFIVFTSDDRMWAVAHPYVSGRLMIKVSDLPSCNEIQILRKHVSHTASATASVCRSSSSI
jgi:hypothetical protein